jgi:aminopeptidase
MKDQRLQALAKNLLEHSLNINPGEKLMISAPVVAKPLIQALVELAYEKELLPFVRLYDEEISRWVAQRSSEERQRIETSWDIAALNDIDAYISIMAEENDAEFSAVSPDIMQMRSRVRKPWSDIVTNQKKWVLLNWPTTGQAQKARMPYSEFCDFIIDVSCVDYAQMGAHMQPLSELMSKTDRVHIKGPGTDLSFSIKGIANVPCAGENNIPDGEVFTAPVKDSVEGTLTYNTPCPYHGKVYNKVCLEFSQGRIVRATAEQDSAALNAVLDTDEGARYIGEFALGVNPRITRAFGNILFDEKIAGSFHFTPGNAYEAEADNGNRSAIHWDMVCIQTPEYGGGEIRFDGVLIRKDGLFVLAELKPLNP